jgi:ABC-type uncharacterized transport system substrate-binding protein
LISSWSISFTERTEIRATFEPYVEGSRSINTLDVLSPKDIETAFRAASNGRADGVLVLNSPVFASHQTQVVDLAVKSRLPAIYWRSGFVEAGGLMSYGTSENDLDRRAATYVDNPERHEGR